MAKKRKSRKNPRPPAPPIMPQLSEARMRLRTGRYEEADAILAPLDRRYPNRPEILELRIQALSRSGQTTEEIEVAERYAQLLAHDPDPQLFLADLYVVTGRPALAYQTFRAFLSRWPDHEESTRARDTVEDMLDPIVRQMWTDQGLEEEEGLELVVMHERLQVETDRFHFEEAKAIGVDLLGRWPRFVPAWNNLSDVYLRQADYNAAIDADRRALEIDPQNAHARSNLTRHLFLAGRFDEADDSVDQLDLITPDNPERALKFVEALAVMGDDEGVRAAATTARSLGSMEPQRMALLEHLDAVAAFRLGLEEEALRRWENALRFSPGFFLAEDNLKDLRRPISKRHAPWPFSLEHWIPSDTIQEFRQRLERVSKRRPTDEDASREIRRILDEHPEMVAMIGPLLDRGPPAGREWALRMALHLRTPAILDILHEYGLSQRGPDALRQQALQGVKDAGRLPPGATRMWSNGEWTEIILWGWEIVDYPTQEANPATAEQMLQAHLFMNERRAAEAEQILREVVTIDPASAAARNNLAQALRLQGKTEEADAIVDHLYAEQPDYLFAAVLVASRLIRAGHIEEAETIVMPLIERPRFHHSEFAALAQVQIDLCLARGHINGAQSWLAMWENVYADHPNLAVYRRRIIDAR